MSNATQVRDISLPFLLLGEGTGESEFFKDLLHEMGLTNVQTEDYGGKNKLAKYLRGLTIRSGFSQLQRIAITRDADDDAEGAAASVDSSVKAARFPSTMSVTTFILPGEGRKGALESLWLESLAGKLFEGCVTGFFDCLVNQGWEPSQYYSKRDKAFAQAWLATKSPSNEAFHRASAYGRRSTYPAEYWVDFNHASWSPLKDFLRSSFS